MMKHFFKKHSGFTLLEMLLVLVIASAMLSMFLTYTTTKADQMRRERTSMQMQQILNASLSYYLTNGAWPTSIANLQSGGFLPTAPLTNPWGQSYSLASATATSPMIYVSTQTATPVDAYIISGMLPLSYATTNTTGTPPQPDASCKGPASPGCNIVAAGVNIPGQNLNNARSVNFASVYHSGACVPAPSCPGTMVPQIMVVPASVSGINDDPAATSPSPAVYPISSYTAYAVGANGPGQGGGPAGPANVSACTSSSAEACTPGSGGDVSGALYWRVCLSVTTVKGLVVVSTSSSDASAWGQATGTVLAFTRCVPANGSGNPTEPAGSDFSVFNN